MKAAFTVWEERIAPVFDVSRQIHLVETDKSNIVSQTRVPLSNAHPAVKAQQLAEMGVTLLVCGAISRTVEQIVAAYGIELICFVHGELSTVVDAWQHGTLGEKSFCMPGRAACRRGGRQWGSSNQAGRNMMNRSTTAEGQGRGKGRCGNGRGDDGGRGQASGAGGRGDVGTAKSDACVCTQCGYQTAHQRGLPCMNRVCPTCGAAMVRKS